MSSERFDTTTHDGLDVLEEAIGDQDSVATLRAMQFATNDRGDRLMSVDPAYRSRVEALYELQYGTTRRDANGQPVKER